MSDYNLIKKVILSSEHKVTGKTRHFKEGDRVINIVELKIVTLDDAPGFYLLYFDKDGKEVTDTLHDTIEKAMNQASWEFDVKPEDWIDL